jgi:threonine dehydratase
VTRGQDSPTLADIVAARTGGRDLIRQTPVLASRSIAERLGSPVVLKAENLQETGSFKLRGALAKLASLPAGASPVLVTGSAGNHAQSLAYAARSRGVSCRVYMPDNAAVAKVEAAVSFGARVERHPGTVDDCIAAARDAAERHGMVFVHPFDDPDVIAGQGTLALELVEQVPDVARVVVPVGGGGLAAGMAIALRSLRPQVRIIGVQAELCAPLAAPLDPAPPPEISYTSIADGIAVKRPGSLTRPILARLMDDLMTVSENEIAEAIVLLLEHAKLLVEGAGAVGVAAALSGRLAPVPGGPTVVVLSGGNIDVGLVGALTRRHETWAHRRLNIFTRVGDRPGSLARLLTLIGEHGGNVLDVHHVRDGVSLDVRETGIRLVIESRGEEHAREILGAVEGDGYPVETLPLPEI